MTKAESCKRHFKKRMLQRFGIEVTQKVIDDIRHQMRVEKDSRLPRQTLTKSRFLINYEGKEMVVIYSKKHHTFITAIPLEWYMEGMED